MYSECFSNIRFFFFSNKVQTLKAKMNSYLNIPVYSLTSLSIIKYENKIINNYRAPHTDISKRKRR